jgi:hypothetical protein
MRRTRSVLLCPQDVILTLPSTDLLRVSSLGIALFNCVMDRQALKRRRNFGVELCALRNVEAEV